MNYVSMTEIAAVGTLIVGVFVFFRGTRKYILANRMKRLEKYEQLSEMWDKDETIQEVIRLIYSDRQALKKLDYRKR